jgi:hypothetical protein
MTICSADPLDRCLPFEEFYVKKIAIFDGSCKAATINTQTLATPIIYNL